MFGIFFYQKSHDNFKYLSWNCPEGNKCQKTPSFEFPKC